MSNRTRLPLGDYYQLLLRHGLLADAAPLAADLTHPVSLVSCDSKLVIPNTLFVCKGVKFKEEYLCSAMEQGAFAYVSEREYPPALHPGHRYPAGHGPLGRPGLRPSLRGAADHRHHRHQGQDHHGLLY